MKHLLFLTVCLILLSCGKNRTNNYNTAAALRDTLLLQPNEWKVITSSINTSTHTMATLYGNEVAVKAARSGQGSYPAGASLLLVTWKQQPDDHWFGAIIPGAVETVEQVVYTTGSISPFYTKYTGNLLAKSIVNPEESQHRIAWMIQQRAAVMP
jgi:Cytochrome P460